MAASAFHPISTSLTLISQTLSEVADAIPQGTSGEGATAEALVAKLQSWRGAFGEIAEHMSTQVSGPVSETAAADDELTRHPSPLQVQEAEDKARQARKLLMSKMITAPAYQQVESEAKAIREEREEAVKRHREAIKAMDKFEAKDHGNNLAGADPYGSGEAFGGLNGGVGGGSSFVGGGVPASTIGTAISGDPMGSSSARVSGVPQPPTMPPMMSQPAMGGGEMPQQGMGGMPAGGAMPGATPRDAKRKQDDKDSVATGLSADLGSGGAVAATATAAPESRGSSLRGVATHANISGLGGASTTGNAPPPGSSGPGGPGGRGAMMGGAPMGSMGSGAGLKGAKPRPDIKTSDAALLGDTIADSAVQGGRIGRESVKPMSEAAQK